MKEIVILLVVLCISAIGLSGAVAAWYFLYYRPKTMAPTPAPVAVLAPTYQTVVALPPPVPKTGGGTGGSWERSYSAGHHFQRSDNQSRQTTS